MEKGRLTSNSVYSINYYQLLLLILCISMFAYSNAKQECDALTGNLHTRVTWREGGHPISGSGTAIKGFDSKTGKTTTIWNDKCIKSVICDGGHKVLITSGDYKVWVVDWDGSNKKQLTSGSVSDGWRDPETGKEWAIYRGQGNGTGGGVHRICISDPSEKVEIYNGKEGHKVYPWFQMSADGKMAASFFPYNKGGVYDVAAKKVTFVVSKRCWSGMASDNSYNWFHLNGNHKELVSYNKSKKIGVFNAMPPIKPTGQLYCPRAAEGPKEGGLFFTLCGGYPGYNKNGNTVEVFIGKLNTSYNKVEKWARITNNNVPDQHPSVWIGVEPGTGLAETAKKSSVPVSQLPVKLINPKTVELRISQKDVFKVEIVNPLGVVIKEASLSGPVNFQWSGQTSGVYLIRLTGKNYKVNKRIALW